MSITRDKVVLLAVRIIVGDGTSQAILVAPRVGADARARGVGRVLKTRGVERAGAEDGGHTNPRPGRDAEAVVEAARILEGSTHSAVEAAHDVRVQESMPALDGGLARGVLVEGDACERQVGVAIERSGIVDDVNRERSELGAVEAARGKPGEIARARGARSHDIAGDDLALGFIKAHALAHGLDLEDAFEQRQGREEGRVYAGHGVQVAADRTHADQLLRHQLQIGQSFLGAWSVDDLHRDLHRLVVLAVQEGAQARMDPKGGLEGAGVLHFTGSFGPSSQGGHPAGLHLDHKSVHGDGVDDARAEFSEGM